MEKQYKVVFVYADGHIEEIEELFQNGKEALEYGNNLLAQVSCTEGQTRGTKNEFIEYGDEFLIKEKIKPHFMIVEIKGKKYRLVYDSDYAQ